jgi:hypothetical protein
MHHTKIEEWITYNYVHSYSFTFRFNNKFNFKAKKCPNGWTLKFFKIQKMLSHFLFQFKFTEFDTFLEKKSTLQRQRNSNIFGILKYLKFTFYYMKHNNLLLYTEYNNQVDNNITFFSLVEFELRVILH